MPGYTLYFVFTRFFFNVCILLGMFSFGLPVINTLKIRGCDFNPSLPNKTPRSPVGDKGVTGEPSSCLLTLARGLQRKSGRRGVL